MGKVVAVLALAIVMALLGAAGFVWWQGRGATGELAGAVKQAGAATVSAGQAEAETQAVRITTAGAARDRAAAAIHWENRDALLQAPGADAALDPGFVQRLDSGLCQYAAYRDDPGCAGLLQADPAQLSPADQGRGPP